MDYTDDSLIGQQLVHREASRAGAPAVVTVARGVRIVEADLFVSGGRCRGNSDRYIDLLIAHPRCCGDLQAGDLDYGLSVKELTMESDRLAGCAFAHGSGIGGADFRPVTNGQATVAHVGV